MSNLATIFDNAAIVDPLRIQQIVLDDLQNRLMTTTETQVVSDPNHVTAVLLESFSTITASHANAVQVALQGLYPRRATTMQDLMRHMSDYDYLGIYSSPCTTQLDLYLDPDYLASKAEVIAGTDFKRARIPANSTFIVAGVPFGVHYPINVDVNPDTGNIVAAWDVSEINPLHTVAQSSLVQFRTSWNGLNLVSIRIPVHQFAINEIIESTNLAVGFNKIINYTDSFYAVRVFSFDDDSNWVEINQTLSEHVYDPAVLTALVEIDTQAKRFGVSIPRVYFDESMVGSKIKIMTYTTVGEVNMELSDAEVNTVTISIPNVDIYSSIFSRIPTMQMVPVSRNINGGTNGISMAELKDRIITRSLATNVLVTPAQLNTYFNDLGFAITRYRDGLTDRIFYASRRLEDNEGIPIVAGTITMKLTGDLLEECSEHIRSGMDDSVVVLPSAIFKYDPALGYCTPITDTKYDDVLGNDVAKTAKITYFNDGTYLQSPYHIKLYPAYKYPVAYSYDLLHPTVNKIDFIRENTTLSTQLTIRNVSLTHLADGTGGYQLLVTVEASSDLVTAIATVDDPAAALMLYVETENSLGDEVHLTADYISHNGNMFYFSVDLSTNYAITIDHEIRFTEFVDNYGNSTYDFPLTGDYTIVTMISKALAVDIHGESLINDQASPTNSTERLNENAYIVYGDTFIHLSNQVLNLTFGEYLEHVNNEVRVIANETDYQRYDTTIYATESADTYRRNPDGSLVISTFGDQLILDQTGRQGDWLFGSSNWMDVITTLTAGSTVATILVDTNFEAGMCVRGMQVPIGTKLLQVDEAGTRLVLSQAALTTGNFVLRIGYPTVIHEVGDLYLDGNQNPVPIGARELEYQLNGILVDSKLSISEQPEHADYLFDITELLRGYYATLATAKQLLVEGTELYFRPQQSVGLAPFTIASGEIINRNLELELGFRLYITEAANSDPIVLDRLRNSVQDIVDEHLDTGEVNCSKLAANIVSRLSDQVVNVDILGIDNDPSLQTLLKVGVGNRPSLAQELVLLDDGTIGVARKLTIEFSVP